MCCPRIIKNMQAVLKPWWCPFPVQVGGLHQKTISGGGLPTSYKAVQFHLHWGTNGGPGSEHTIDGEQFPMEVMKNTRLTAVRWHYWQQIFTMLWQMLLCYDQTVHLRVSNTLHFSIPFFCISYFTVYFKPISLCLLPLSILVSAAVSLKAHSCQHESLIAGYKYIDSLKKDSAVSLNIQARAMSKCHSDWSK